MMEEKIINEEQEEVLENTIPEELHTYLEADEETLEKVEKVLNDLDERMDSLQNEKVESEKNFDDRLEEFKQMIAKEKEEAFNEFAKREEEIDAEKSRVESIKLSEQSKQVNYIDTLKEISEEYSSKINSIEEAIKACEDNETLSKALEEEKNKLEEALSNEYESRKEELNKVLVDIGIEEKTVSKPNKKEIEIEEPKINLDIDPDTIINLDFRTSEEKEKDLLKNNFEESYDNEVVSHEPREDVINEIYQSEDVMEGHVFPYLRSIKE